MRIDTRGRGEGAAVRGRNLVNSLEDIVVAVNAVGDRAIEDLPRNATQRRKLLDANNYSKHRAIYF